MGTLGGFPYPPALWLRRAKPGFAYAIIMGTLGGFPYPPALWLRRAKPGFAYAIIMGTLGGFGGALGSCHPPCLPPRCARPRHTLGPYRHPPSHSLRSASRAMAPENFRVWATAVSQWIEVPSCA
jgi:hypothetical protein